MSDRTRDLLKLLATATIAATMPSLLAGVSKPESAVIALLAVAATFVAGFKKMPSRKKMSLRAG